MKKILLVIALILPLSASAVSPGEIFGSIFNLILDQIKKDQNGNVDQNAKVILKWNGNRIIFGRVFIDSNKGDVDTLNLPGCGPNKLNKAVHQVRLRVAEAAVHINTVKITFNNGNSATVDVDDKFAKGENSSWYNLPGDARCIRKIRVNGYTTSNVNNKVSAITFVGRRQNGPGFDNDNDFEFN